MNLRARATAWLRFALIPAGLLVISGASLTPPALLAGDARPFVMTGHVLTNLARATRIAALPSSKNLTLTIALRPASAGARDASVQQALAVEGYATAALSPDDVGRTFGQPQANIELVAAHFRAAGFQIGQAQPDHLTFQVTGSVSQVEQLLAVKLATYTDAVGHSFYATSLDPQLPANLAQYVQAIFGLDNYPAFQPLRRATTPIPGAYVPRDLQTAYNVTPAYGQGWSGFGQTIGIIGCDAFLTKDITDFRTAYSIPPTTISTVSVDGGADGGSAETTIDLEWSGAIATGAALRYYGFPSTPGGCGFQGFLDSVSKAVNENVAGVITISLGACEAFYQGLSPSGSTATFLQAMENEFAAAVAEKIGVFAASGDQGAYSCTDGSSFGPPTVAYPASSAYVVGVGGTTLTINPDSSYNSESAWSSQTECALPCGGGGGFSSVFAEPIWQTQANIPDVSGMRGVPDISLNADPASGYTVNFTANGSTGCTGFCGMVGGTSVAAPEWAGLAAIANQAVGRRLGNLNPFLYGRFLWTTESSNGSTPFHDVTSGNNLFYSAAADWDAATGLGSPNTFAVVQGLLASQCEGTLSSGAMTPVALPFQIYLPFVPSC